MADVVLNIGRVLRFVINNNLAVIFPDNSRRKRLYQTFDRDQSHALRDRTRLGSVMLHNAQSQTPQQQPARWVARYTRSACHQWAKRRTGYCDFIFVTAIKPGDVRSIFVRKHLQHTWKEERFTRIDFRNFFLWQSH